MGESTGRLDAGERERQLNRGRLSPDAGEMTGLHFDQWLGTAELDKYEIKILRENKMHE